MDNGQLKRFENKAQLIRHIHDETDIPIDELWDEYNRQYGSSNGAEDERTTEKE